MQYQRDELLKDMQENICQVFFKNVSKDLVGLRCTLKPDILPESYSLTESEKVKDFHNTNQNMLAVWDIEKNMWKKFNINDIEYVQIIDTY